MIRKDALEKGRRFFGRAQDYRRVLFVYAHHDDEIPTAGLLQRLGQKAHVLWLTNSDGLYFESELSPAQYGQLRKQEGLRSVELAGVEPGRTRCLDFSEVEIYRRFSWLATRKSLARELRSFFQPMLDGIVQYLLEVQPDAVFTQAWQGGHPEHDLVHFLTARALRVFESRVERRPDFFHLPAYEYTILVAMRFSPFYRGERIRLKLSPSELETKLRMMDVYRSQQKLFRQFRASLRWFSLPAGWISGGPYSLEQFLSLEEFGPVPANIDYRLSPHWLDRLNYIGDDFEGVPVSFTRCLRPLVDEFMD
jgi:LmbE family N-acetylglucosaminyl deacetylase